MRKMRGSSPVFTIATRLLLNSAVVAAVGLGVVTLTSDSAHAYTINYALSSMGATFVGASSTIGINDPVMESDLLTDNKVAWTGDGDTRFIFGNQASTSDQTLEINLGQVRTITDIGTTFTQNDRPTIGPISIEVSLNGITWTNWGSPVAITWANSSVDITELPTAVEYILFNYGVPSNEYPGDGGSAVGSIFADIDPVPLPSAWSMLVVGFVGFGFLAYRGRPKPPGKLAAG
jgi:hypothetical protein